MLIDCHTCEVRDIACDDCVVTVLLGPTRLDSGTTFAEALPVGTPLGAHPIHEVALDADERAALAVLADSGLVPPLRLVSPSAGSGPRSEAGLGRTTDDSTVQSSGHAV